MSTQPPPARPWLLRLGSQVRNIDPSPTQPQPSPQPRGPPIRQASLALGRTTALSPPATLPVAPPPQPPVPLSGLGSQVWNIDPSPTQPQPSPQPRGPPIRQASLALGRTTALSPPATLPAAPPPQPPVPLSGPAPATANGNGPTITPIAEAPRAQTPPSAPVPVAPTLTRSLTPPQLHKVVANPSPSSSLSAPKPEPKLNPISPTAAENGPPEKNGGKGILGGGAGEPLKANRNDSFNKCNGEAKAPSSASPKNEDKKNPPKSEAKDVTFAGRNIGAFMDLGAAYGRQTEKKQPQQQQLFYYVRGQPQTEVKKTNVGEAYDYYTDTESEVNGAKQQKPFFSLVNSNVQSVNNSLLLGAASVQGSPGVHVNLGRSSRPRKNGDDSSAQKRSPSLR